MPARNFLKLFSVIAILSVFFSGLQPPLVRAQGGDGLQRQVNAESGRVSFISPESGRALPAAKALGQSIRPQDPLKYCPQNLVTRQEMAVFIVRAFHLPLP